MIYLYYIGWEKMVIKHKYKYNNIHKNNTKTCKIPFLVRNVIGGETWTFLC